MKKLIVFLTMLFSIGMTCIGMAAEKENTQEPAKQPTNFSEKLQKHIDETKKGPVDLEQLAKRPNVAVIYVNNAKTTYDDEIDELLLGNLAKNLPSDKFQYIDGAPYAERLNKIGIVDIASAERADIVNAFSGENIDYVIFLELQPFIRKDKVTFFTIGKEMTATVPLKVIDLVNNRYLYNGKFVEKASDSTMIGDIGNKSVSNKALLKINEQVSAVLAVRLPAEKSVLIVPAK